MQEILEVLEVQINSEDHVLRKDVDLLRVSNLILSNIKNESLPLKIRIIIIIVIITICSGNVIDNI